MRAAADKMRQTPAAALDEIEDFVREGESPALRREAELKTELARWLSPDELKMASALMDGYTQKELAAALGISQQAVSGRLRKIRRKLAPLRDSLCGK